MGLFPADVDICCASSYLPLPSVVSLLQQPVDLGPAQINRLLRGVHVHPHPFDLSSVRRESLQIGNAGEFLPNVAQSLAPTGLSEQSAIGCL